MPLYDYKCQQHGVFHELIAMDERSAAHPCPTCLQLAPRVIMMPQILTMDSGVRKARHTNERSRHEPVISSAASRDHRHGSGCGCEQADKLHSKAVLLADGSKIFPSARPWMISH